MLMQSIILIPRYIDITVTLLFPMCLVRLVFCLSSFLFTV